MIDEKHTHSHRQNRFAVIPTAVKLNAGDRFTGRGVTIAFLDSGFCPHPDFAARVVAFHDVSGEENRLSGGQPKAHHWHGTQTVASCAGDGHLSDGIYRGLASDARLVLVKVSRNGRIGDREIEAGLRWIAANRERYGIRILNMSLGGDADAMSAASPINRLAEALVRAGVVVTVAAGNAGDTHSIPPANAPSVITVGGYSDSNGFDPGQFAAYNSNYGATADGLVKPELIAPAMYVAAPILPETDDYAAAESLSLLADAPDYAFPERLREYREAAGLDKEIAELEPDAARKLVEYALNQRRIVATHYKHVDGTSFAAPIAASVAARMLEANPALSPAAVKHILISTAYRVGSIPAIRQGFGILNAKEAVAAALGETHLAATASLAPPRVTNGAVVFVHHDDRARRVSVAGDFNGWDASAHEFKRDRTGSWRAEIGGIAGGEYRYKFVVDGREWKEDPSNLMKREDGFGGFNSILNVL
jgi:serine protease AprX